MRVANVVREGEEHIGEVEERQENPATPLDREKPRQTQRREQEGPSKLLHCAESIHRDAVDQHRAWELEHHRFAPVRFCHVEPERPQRVGERRRRIRPLPEASKIPGVLKGAGGGDHGGEHNDAWPEHGSPASRRSHQ